MKALRNPLHPYIEEVRPITKDDLQGLREPAARYRIQRLRDSHHNMARLFALGLSNSEVAARTGFSLQTTCLYHNDPAIKELIEHYRGQVTDAWRESVDNYMELATQNMIKAERQISDKLDAADEAGELLPTRELIAISRDAADRFGYGKKTTNLNVNVDFAAKLEAARKRSNKVIEGTLVDE